MDESLVRVMPDKEKARSILKMVETTLEMVRETNIDKFPSNVTKEYYEVIRELISIILLLDGYKARGEGAHKRQIDYLEENYSQFTKSEIIFMDGMRITRNKIAYNGLFVTKDYIKRKLTQISKIIDKLQITIKSKMS